MLLLLKPFLCHRNNFIRIKSLFNQFQGYYKRKYHFFAAYYLIYRQVIFVIVFVADKNYCIICIQFNHYCHDTHLCAALQEGIPECLGWYHFINHMHGASCQLEYFCFITVNCCNCGDFSAVSNIIVVVSDSCYKIDWCCSQHV